MMSQGFVRQPGAASVLSPARWGRVPSTVKLFAQNPGTLESRIQEEIPSSRSFSVDSCLIPPMTQLGEYNYKAASGGLSGRWGGGRSFHLESVGAAHQITAS